MANQDGMDSVTIHKDTESQPIKDLAPVIEEEANKITVLYREGHKAGYEAGHTQGYQLGWGAGYREGHSKGYSEGYVKALERALKRLGEGGKDNEKLEDKDN